MFIKRSYKDHFIHYSTHRSKKQVFFGRCVKQLFAFYGDPYFRMIVFIRCPFGVFYRVVTELYAPACCNTGIHSENSKAKYSHAPKRPTLLHRRRCDPRYSPPPSFVSSCHGARRNVKLIRCKCRKRGNSAERGYEHCHHTQKDCYRECFLQFNSSLFSFAPYFA